VVGAGVLDEEALDVVAEDASLVLALPFDEADASEVLSLLVAPDSLFAVSDESVRFELLPFL